MTRLLKTGLIAGLIILATCSSALAYPSSAQNSFALTGTNGSCTWNVYSRTAHTGYGTLGTSGELWLGADLTCSAGTYGGGVTGPELLLRADVTQNGVTVAGQHENLIGRPWDSSSQDGLPAVWCECLHDSFDEWGAAGTGEDYFVAHTARIDVKPYEYYLYGPSNQNLNYFWTSYPSYCSVNRNDISELDCTMTQAVTV